MRIFISLLFVCIFAAAELPMQVSDTSVMENEEFLLRKIQSLKTGPKKLANYTMAELLVKVPEGLGELQYCTTCVPPKVTVSTGTSAGNYADAIGGTFK